MERGRGGATTREIPEKERIVKAGCITKTLRMNSCVIIIDVKKHAMLLAGKMKGIAFIKDPDGYWIEIFDLKTIGSTTSGAA
ncbi:hypothetical protein CsSME_00040666 [Camellia sinensis var. sinensis]